MWQIVAYVVNATIKFVGWSAVVTAVTTNLYGNYYFYQQSRLKITDKQKYKQL